MVDNGESPLFDANSKYDLWQEDDFFYAGMRHRETGQANGIVRQWKKDGPIWEYTAKNGKFKGACLHINDDPFTTFCLYDINEAGDSF